jgi:fused signal recognition particle receptor
MQPADEPDLEEPPLPSVEQPPTEKQDISPLAAAGEAVADRRKSSAPRQDTAPALSQAEETKVPSEEPSLEKPSGLFARLKQGLTKTRRFLNSDIEALFQGRKKIDDEVLEELEELLITADIGVQTTMDLIDRISGHATDITDADQLRTILKTEIQSLLKADSLPKQDVSSQEDTTPRVIMVIGVNGVGKTTTIGKLAAHYSAENKKVLIAAADTFRAAAVEQAAIWAERSKADLVRHKDGSDPAAVAFDSVEAGLARGCDIVLIDTAGRLHTKVNLMEELKKIKRSVNKKLPGAPHEILLVLDATTGQNALTQAKNFHEALDVTGIALTKLDGTAKGGIVVSICHSLNVPLMYIGVGEQIHDLQAFDADKFVNALF